MSGDGVIDTALLETICCSILLNHLCDDNPVPLAPSLHLPAFLGASHLINSANSGVKSFLLSVKPLIYLGLENENYSFK